MTREQVTQRVAQSDRDKATLRYGDQAERQAVREKRKKKTSKPAAASAGSRAALYPQGPSPTAVLRLGWGMDSETARSEF